MSVFLFEFITCGGKASEEIAVEGLGMFNSLLKGFSEFIDINSIVDERYGSLFPQMPSQRFTEFEEIQEKVVEFAENSDCFIVIAPEDDNLLFELTKMAESRSVNLGSSSEGIEIASNKWKTYRKLKNKVNTPLTSKKPLDPPFLIKPEKSCGGEGIKLVENEVERLEEGYIAQEIIQGKPLSVSLIVGENIEILSVNEQIIDNFAYTGAIVPAKIEDEEVVELAIKSVECIKGLHGYVGVDVVLGNQPYIIEINARITTPSIAFEKVYGINLSKIIYDNTFNDEGIEINQEGLNLWKGKRYILEKAVGRKEVGNTKGFEEIVRFGNRALICREV